MAEEEHPETVLMEARHGDEPPKFWDCFLAPLRWIIVLVKEVHWSFVFGIVVSFGISQGFSASLAKVGIMYYMKDVLKLQPSKAQYIQGIYSIPWFIKPVWGLMTDLIPVLGYHRRPYFIFAGILGIVPMLYLCWDKDVHVISTVLALTAGSAASSIAEVTIDACYAQNSHKHQHLASDMQSLCALTAASGSLIGFFISGILVHSIGPKGVFGVLAIPSVFVILVGIVLLEPRTTVNFSCKQVGRKACDATRAMKNTLILPEVWRPCLYIFLSNILSLNIEDGLFFWYSDSDSGPKFSEEYVGFLRSIGTIGAILGSLLYQYSLKNYRFRGLCFWSQLLLSVSGMLDLLLVLRLNLKLGIPDHIFAVFDVCVVEFISKLKYIPMLVLGSKICPPGIEGTFFSLIVSINYFGTMSAGSLGGYLLKALNITRITFDNLWIAVMIRNVLRLSPLLVIFLVPNADPNAPSILPPEVLNTENAESVDRMMSKDSKEGEYPL